jgi:hypothetical protein
MLINNTSSNNKGIKHEHFKEELRRRYAKDFTEDDSPTPLAVKLLTGIAVTWAVSYIFYKKMQAR